MVSYYMNAQIMGDLLKSGLFGLAFLVMLTIASIQFEEGRTKKTDTLAKVEGSAQTKIELANKEGIHIPL
ncbi:MAG: hypothetical protein ED555_05415 [Allomuricauda sp.]|nr:MAG: hypothetical protein ED555_05415 [Allomuricauda sp.]